MSDKTVTTPVARKLRQAIACLYLGGLLTKEQHVNMLLAWRNKFAANEVKDAEA